ncbi:MAG: methyltransferase domain-containing protein [Candidatus Poribacteria bacterium]|nr:methyltransferase domain-containing protein [Candidatus Poribacteria bacterium]
MHEGHIEQLPLICPRCRSPEVQSPLELQQIFKRDGGFILEGFLVCSFQGCQMAYPILAGVPIIVKDVEAWWNAEQSKLSSVACGTPQIRVYFDALSQSEPNRHAEKALLSTYMESHYATHERAPQGFGGFADSGVFWERVVDIAQPDTRHKHALDLGCSVGRCTFELARFSELAVGIDLNFDAVSAAAGMQRTGTVSYERRKRGRCFETVQMPYSPPQNALFLVGDALDPPFLAESFDLVAGLNLIDNVSLPLVLIGQMDALLRDGGTLVLSSPYEWRADIAERAEWLENDALDAATMVRNILEGGLFPQMGLKYEILSELLDVPWVLRHHDRYWSLFLVHLIKARKRELAS